MPGLTIVYWRDIPAQVLVGKGRQAARAALAERFEQAIDRAAMKSGARETDAYLADWRRETGADVAGDPQALAEAAAARLEAEYTPERLQALVANEGRA